MPANPKASRAVTDGKDPLDYLEPPADAAIARVMHTGALKYGRRNYRDTDMLITTYVGAIRRHAAAWLSGEDLDPDDGEHHLAHIGACVHVCMGALDADKMVDDREIMESLPASDRVHKNGDMSAKIGSVADTSAPSVLSHPACGTADCCGSCVPAAPASSFVCCMTVRNPKHYLITTYCLARCSVGPLSARADALGERTSWRDWRDQAVPT